MTSVISLNDLKTKGQTVSDFNQSSILKDIKAMGDIIDDCEKVALDIIESKYPGRTITEYKNLFAKIKIVKSNFNDLKQLHIIKEIMEIMIIAIRNLPVDSSAFVSLPSRLGNKFIESSPTVVSSLSSLSLNIDSINIVNFKRTFEWKVLQLDLSKHAKEKASFLLELRL